MISLPRIGRKKARGGGSYRAPQPQVKHADRSRRVRFLLLLAAFVLLVAAVTERITPSTESARILETEGYAAETIKADIQFHAPDLEATRLARDAAAAKVPSTYRVDRGLVRERMTQYEESIELIKAQHPAAEKAIRAALLSSAPEERVDDVVTKALGSVAAQMAALPAFKEAAVQALIPWLKPSADSVPERILSAAQDGSSQIVTGLKDTGGPMLFPQTERLAGLGRESLNLTLNLGVLGQESAPALPPPIAASAGPEAPVEDSIPGIVVVRSQVVEGHPRSQEFSRTDAPLLKTARTALRDHIRAMASQSGANEPSDATEDWGELQEAAFEVAQLALGATLTFDEVTTGELQTDARRQVAPVTKLIKKNQPIQEGGRPWDDQTRSDYLTYMDEKARREKRGLGILATLAANMMLVGLTLLCLDRTFRLVTPVSDEVAVRNLTLVLLVMIATLLIGRVVSHIDPAGSMGFLVPVAAGAVLLAILLNTRSAATASLLTAFLLSVQHGYDWALCAVGSAMSFAGVLSIYRVRKRSDIGRAAVNATLVGLVAVAAVTLATDAFAVHWHSRLIMVFFNGVACWFIISAFLSPLEHLFGITTDIQLLEYSDLNNEVLGRLAIEIPATYAHSLMLGQLAEAACDAIGANGLLARVCAYYHDIGKLRRPEYFVENQTGANIHDDLSPRLSARAIASHVTEGAEMAREFHLPKPLVDAVYEHHGTTQISFFYKQALAQQKHGDVREEDFRYPGPKPQTRETAVLMICDAVESAVRSLGNPNAERVRELTEKIVSARSGDGQFDECDLTLRDLDTISEVVSKRIVSSLHRRISYPDHRPEQKEEASNVIPLSGGQDS